MRAIATTLVDVPVHVPPPAEYVALGAARQAAWALAGGPEPPAWPLDGVAVLGPTPHPDVRAAYAQVRTAVHPS